jgi:hypothetical protein
LLLFIKPLNIYRTICEFVTGRLKSLTKCKKLLILLFIGTLFYTQHESKKTCGCGGIGRRAGFRCLWALARGGSTPLIRIGLVSHKPHVTLPPQKTRTYTKLDWYRPRTYNEPLADDVDSHMPPGKATNYHVVNRPLPVIDSIEQKYINTKAYLKPARSRISPSVKALL